MISSSPNPTPKKLLVLFIHGLGGDGTTTWGKFPELLRADKDLNEKIDVALFRYDPISEVAVPRKVGSNSRFSCECSYRN
jgi:hypothetical protein